MSYDPEKNKARCRAYYLAHREKWIAYRITHRKERAASQRIYQATHREERNQYSRTYRKANRDKTRLWARSQYWNHPQEHRARSLANWHKPKRESCEVCGNSKTQYHHDDYSEPLNVRHLCLRHHVELHNTK